MERLEQAEPARRQGPAGTIARRAATSVLDCGQIFREPFRHLQVVRFKSFVKLFENGRKQAASLDDP